MVTGKCLFLDRFVRHIKWPCIGLVVGFDNLQYTEDYLYTSMFDML